MAQLATEISGKLAGGQLVDLVWLNKASIPNFSGLGIPEVAVHLYFPGWGGWQAKSQFKLD